MKAIVVREFGGPEVMKVEEVAGSGAGAGAGAGATARVGVNPYDTYMLSGQLRDQTAAALHAGRRRRGRRRSRGRRSERRRARHRASTSAARQPQEPTARTPRRSCASATRSTRCPIASRSRRARLSTCRMSRRGARCISARRIQPGETLFIHGASGGVGLAATQIARACGLTVIGTAGTAEGLALVKAQGARHVAEPPRERTISIRLKDLTDGTRAGRHPRESRQRQSRQRSHRPRLRRPYRHRRQPRTHRNRSAQKRWPRTARLWGWRCGTRRRRT